MAKSSNAKLSAQLEVASKAAGELGAMRKVLSGYADDALKSLPKEWQEHLRELSGDNPAKLLDLVRKTEKLRAQPEAPATPPTPPAKLASTAPSPPPPAANSGDPDLAALAYLEALQRAGKRILAASYEASNAAALARARVKRGPANAN